MIGDRIKELRLSKGYNMRQMATALNLPYTTYVNYEKGAREPSSEQILLIAKYFDVSTDYIMGRTEKICPSEPSNVGIIEPSENIKIIPVFGNVSAGFGAYACSDIIEYAPALIFGRGDDYIYINVEGDSMSPKIEEGDRILVRKQDMCDSGDIAVIMLKSDEAVVKKVTFGDGYITLTSFNPQYPPRTFVGAEMEDMSIVGKVINVTKPL